MRTAPGSSVAGAMIANSVGPSRPIASDARPGAAHDGAESLDHDLGDRGRRGLCFGGRDGRERDAGDRRAQTLRIRGHFARAAHHSLHVVQSGRLIEQTLVAQPIDRALAAHVRSRA